MKPKTSLKQEFSSPIDTGKVVGSIPITPTIPFPNKITQAFELPEEFHVVVGVEWKRGRCRMFRVLIPISTKRREKTVKSRRIKKSA